MSSVEQQRRRASIASVGALLERHDAEVAERLVEAIEAIDAPDALDPALWGEAPAATDQVAAVGRSLAAEERQRRAVLAGALGRREAAERLGVSTQAVTNRLEGGRLVGLQVGREWRLPAWQFDARGRAGTLQGLEQLIASYPGGAVSLSVWATAGQPELDGATPRQALRAGRVDEVVRLAAALDAAGW
jgi:hypothetical protein